MNINFGPMPFFHLNGLLNEEQTREQLLGAKQVGYGGVALLPVFETRPSFLSDAYFDQYEVFLKTCRELGLQVILYDDRDFPSGIAGNKIEQAPEHVSKALTKTEKAVFGPALYEEVLSPEGYLCSAAMNTATRETFDLAPYIQNGCLCWNVPEGEFLVMHFSLAAGGHTAVVDYLNPASCQVFLDLALTPYWNRFKTYFGDPIIMTFTDDIAFYHTHHAKAWTPGFNRAFTKKHGFSPVPLYPALWYDIGENTRAARFLLHDMRATLLSEGFVKAEAGWATKRGLLATGHQSGTRQENPVFLSGDHLKFLKHMSAPGMDNIFHYREYAKAYKLTASAAICAGRELVMCETYGASTPTPFEIMSCLIEQFLKGINFVIPHGMWYNQSDIRITPNLNYNSAEYRQVLLAYNALHAALAKALRPGRTVCEAAVVYPIETMLSYKEFDFSEEMMDYVYNPCAVTPPYLDYMDVGECIYSQARRDFTYLHPEVLLSNCRVEEGRLVLNQDQAYRVVVLPACEVVSVKTLEILLAFKESGGAVLFTGLLPDKSAEPGQDANVKSLCEKLFGGCLHTPVGNPLANAVNAALEGGDVCIRCNISPSDGLVSYIHKRQDGGDLYCFGNSSSQDANVEIEMQGAFLPMRYDIQTQALSPMDFTQIDGRVCIKTRLKSLEILLIKRQ